MIDLINEYLNSYGLLVVFIFMATNGFISSPPSEVTLALAGLWASTGESTFVLVILVAVLGNMIGAYALYYIGRTHDISWVDDLKDRHYKSKWANKFVNKLPSLSRLEALADLFNRNGWLLIGVFRCFPVVRSIVSLPAGMSDMPVSQFTLASLIGMTIWALFWSGLGALSFNIYTSYSGHITVALFLVLSLCLAIIYSVLKKLSLQLQEIEHNN